jgi:hypothetical protein
MQLLSWVKPSEGEAVRKIGGFTIGIDRKRADPHGNVSWSRSLFLKKL